MHNTYFLHKNYVSHNRHVMCMLVFWQDWQQIVVLLETRFWKVCPDMF